MMYCMYCIILIMLFFNSEFSTLDAELDRLNAVLDKLEEKNDSIHGQLKELLESSRNQRLQRDQQSQPEKKT